MAVSAWLTFVTACRSVNAGERGDERREDDHEEARIESLDIAEQRRRAGGVVRVGHVALHGQVTAIEGDHLQRL